jgi:hypothetical protein
MREKSLMIVMKKTLDVGLKKVKTTTPLSSP